jgi:hypothetical protein
VFVFSQVRAQAPRQGDDKSHHTYVDDPWFGLLQFIVSEVENALLELDRREGPDPNGVPPLILKNCASAFTLPLCMLFNRSLVTCIFSDRWKLLFVTPIFKSGRSTMIYRITVALRFLSAIAKLFEFLVYWVMYEG